MQTIGLVTTPSFDHFSCFWVRPNVKNKNWVGTQTNKEIRGTVLPNKPWAGLVLFIPAPEHKERLLQTQSEQHKDSEASVPARCPAAWQTCSWAGWWPRRPPTDAKPSGTCRKRSPPVAWQHSDDLAPLPPRCVLPYSGWRSGYLKMPGRWLISSKQLQESGILHKMGTNMNQTQLKEADGEMKENKARCLTRRVQIKRISNPYFHLRGYLMNLNFLIVECVLSAENQSPSKTLFNIFIKSSTTCYFSLKYNFFEI